MSRSGSHYPSDLEAMEAELLRWAREPQSDHRTKAMLVLQTRINQREFRVNGQDSEIALARGQSATLPEAYAESETSTFNGGVLLLMKAIFFRVMEARVCRREMLCYAMAFGFDHPSYPSCRKAALAFGCSNEEISCRVKEIQREFNLPRNQFNKSAKATAKYQANGARRKIA